MTGGGGESWGNGGTYQSQTSSGPYSGSNARGTMSGTSTQSGLAETSYSYNENVAWGSAAGWAAPSGSQTSGADGWSNSYYNVSGTQASPPPAGARQAEGASRTAAAGPRAKAAAITPPTAPPAITRWPPTAPGTRPAASG